MSKKNSPHFIVGAHVGTTWEFYGVFSTVGRAIRACTTPFHFYFPTRMNVRIPDEPVNVEVVYPARKTKRMKRTQQLASSNISSPGLEPMKDSTPTKERIATLKKNAVT
jgi:hypothetical protein